ncbi:hypothetical protein A2U01_0046496, partial [Trifolium medium]|nr:hypothetical protein [Trifolium medium]
YGVQLTCMVALKLNVDDLSGSLHDQIVVLESIVCPVECSDNCSASE